MAAIGVQPQLNTQQHQYQPQQQRPYQQQMHQQQQVYPNHSIMEDSDDGEDEDSMEGAIDMDQAQHYTSQHYQQQQQQMYYQHQQQQMDGAGGHEAGQSSRMAQHGLITQGDMQEGLDEEEYSDDDDESEQDIPDENIDFSLTYALHTFLATVEGQASVVKGDSLLLLDDANSYWWLVRVLKTEDVGYIPAENIETPFERLARLNKHRNVDLAAATAQEKSAADRAEREKLKGMIAGKSRSISMNRSGEGSSNDSNGPRRVIFAPPTYVDHPGKTWISDEEDDSDEDESGDEYMVDGQQEYEDDRSAEHDRDSAQQSVGPDMEPDDGVEWADQATIEQQRRMIANRQSESEAAAPQSNNPYLAARQNSSSDLNGPSSPYDPAHASNDTKRITVTPNVAQGANGSPLLPSAVMQQQQQNGLTARNVSGQSTNSLHSVTSNSSQRSFDPASPDDARKAKKIKKPSKEDLTDNGEKKKKGVLSGLFSRKGKDKDKKGISSSDNRNSEDSIASGPIEGSPASQSRYSVDESPKRPLVSITEDQPDDTNLQAATHSYRLQQRDQALQQSYSSKYLKSSPSSDNSSPIAEQAAAAVAQSAAAMRLAAMNGGGSNRPPSLMVSPNPAGPPLLNVLRVFAGDHIRSEASFKTVLLNETTTSSDLIRQAMQRFHLKGASEPTADSMYYLTIKDMSGEEMELVSAEKPLPAFQEVVARWSDDDESQMMPKVKRSSISSISSMMSLSNHPAIEKLGMNDYGDDSAVKIYLNRRRPGSMQVGNGMAEPTSDVSNYNTQLSTVREASTGAGTQDGISTPPKRNPGLTVNVPSQASPERFSSPSAKFTIQLIIHQSDLPDGSAFDPASDRIISRQVVRDRMAAGHPSPPVAPEPRKRLFVLPRNATVVDAIEQGLERFGISEGVVDGGDDVESKVGDRRSATKVRYTLSAQREGDEHALFPSSKMLEAYTVPPKLRPVERTTKEQRRRSRDVSLTLGDAGEVLPTDPVFILRRVTPKPLGSRTIIPGTLQSQQRQQPAPQSNQDTPRASDRNPKSPQEIIAAQRAVSRATQEALISAQENQSQGVDVVLRDKGTIRSSRLLEPNGSDVVRYSYIDDEGETYDISELLEEEWGQEAIEYLPETRPVPPLTRQTTDQSVYVTAPSTPMDGLDRPILGGPRPSSTASGWSMDLLHTTIQRSAGQPDSKLEEKLHRVIDKVKSTSSMKSSSSMDSVEAGANRPTITAGNSYSSFTSNTSTSATGGRTTPTYTGRSTPSGQISGRTTPQARSLSPLPEGREADLTPRSSSRQSYHNTAATVNRIISRHRQQPSIASIMSDLSVPTPHDDDEESPRTATSSTHPTPPLSLNGGIYKRAVSTSPSPTPRAPISYSDDFGIKALLAIVEARARDLGPVKKVQMRESDEVEKYLVGDKVVMDSVHPEIRGCFQDIQSRLDKFDEEVDDVLAQVGRRRKSKI